MSGENLRQADLSGVYLGGADLYKANLSGAKVTWEQLSTAKSLENATMPDGEKYDPDRHGKLAEGGGEVHCTQTGCNAQGEGVIMNNGVDLL